MAVARITIRTAEAMPDRRWTASRPMRSLPGMFGRDRLLDDGAQVDGVIIEAPQYFRGSTDMRGRYKVTVRVRFDDGSTVEVERRLHLSCGEARAGRPAGEDPLMRELDDLDKL